MNSTSKGYLYALLTAICWSTSGLFVKIVDQSALVISGITAIVAFLFNRIIIRKKIKINKYIVIVGFVQFMMHITFVYANKLTSVGNAIVLQYSSMIFVLLYESIEKKELPMKYQWIVILLAFSGMFIFFMDSFSMDGFLGNILAIISGAFFGLQFFLNTKKEADPSSSLTIQYLFSIGIMVIYVFIEKNVQVSLKDLAYLGGSGIFQTALAGFFFSKCITLIPAFTANVICMSEVIFSPLWAFLFLQEFFTPFAFIGSMIIIVSLFINIYFEYKLKLPK